MHDFQLYDEHGNTGVEDRPCSLGCCESWLKLSVAMLQLADKLGVEAVEGQQNGLGRCQVSWQQPAAGQGATAVRCPLPR